MDIARIRRKAKEQGEKGKAAGAGKPEIDAVAADQEAATQGPVAPEVSADMDDGGPGTLEEDREAVEAVSPAQGTGEPVDLLGTEGESGEEGAALELLTFSLANEEFAFRVSEVEEIIRFQRITRVPTMPDYVRGITSLRGKVIPIIELKVRLALKGGDDTLREAEERRGDRKILILSGPRGFIGATIDKVLGVMRFPADAVLDPPAHLTEDELLYIEGVVILEKRFISIVRAGDALDIELT
jgi:purine-binding chemotaxis protein CheW